MFVLNSIVFKRDVSLLEYKVGYELIRLNWWLCDINWVV